ncbi:MAG: hypothetical protein GC206_01365 [Alphaproteobacteria bacterium]|nr:hypothetical protein [Alphaproteobacteria bacterium]
MKRIAWLSAAGALFAAPALAQGHAGISYQNLDDADVDSLAISGAAALGDNIQIDGRYAYLESDGGDGDAISIGGHLFQRGGGHLLGGYLGYQTVDDDSGFDVDEFIAALEGALYMNRTTWSGAVSYTNADFFIDVDQWALDGEVRHFLTDAFSLQGNAGAFTLDGGSGADGDGWTIGAGGEVQIEGTPFSVHAGYQHVDFDGDSAGSIGIGARMAFGGQSLFARNRSGAGLNRPVGVIDRLIGDLSPR